MGKEQHCGHEPLAMGTPFPILHPPACQGPRCCRSLWETCPSPPCTLWKKKKKKKERNKQTNPFPLLAWHLLTALPLLIRGAAGVISNKPLLMKFRAADPGGAPRHRFSQTLIKFTARRCFWLGSTARWGTGLGEGCGQEGHPGLAPWDSGQDTASARMCHAKGQCRFSLILVLWGPELPSRSAYLLHSLDALQ